MFTINIQNAMHNFDKDDQHMWLLQIVIRRNIKVTCFSGDSRQQLTSDVKQQLN